MLIIFGVQNILFLDRRQGRFDVWFKNLAVINGDHPFLEFFKAINQIKQPRIKWIINGMCVHACVCMCVCGVCMFVRACMHVIN